MKAITDFAWSNRAAASTRSAITLRDWLISRQRYWGAPIPMIYCDTCGIVPVPEKDLPVLLPEDAEFQADRRVAAEILHEAFVNTTCPKCGGPARRETDTMDTFMCSSWYFLRYCQPACTIAGAFDPEKVKYWMPVDQYTGGAEHAVMHLFYARFFTKAIRDMGLVDFDEPFLTAVQPGHHHRRAPEDEQVPRQRGQPGRLRIRAGRRHRARLPDVHRPLGAGRRLERQRHQRHLPAG